MLVVLVLHTFLLLTTPIVSSTDASVHVAKRSIQAGIALNAAWDGSTYKCPAGSSVFLQKWCCPDGYEYDTTSGQFTSYICCPIGGSECSKQVLDCPVCANSDWTYWDLGGTNVPPQLPFCCEQGYAPAPEPLNVCTSGINQFTDYATASQCGQVATAPGSTSPASATSTHSREGGTSSNPTRATATMSATADNSQNSAANPNMSFSNLMLLTAMLLSAFLHPF